MTTRPTILLVDDRKDNLLVLQNLLRESGADTVCANSGNEALALLLTHDCALVLLDIQMPNMDGFETAELMRSREKTMYVPIVFLTAFGHAQEMIFKGYEKGAVDYLFKPIDERILTSKVRVFLELYQQKQRVKEAADEVRKYAETQTILLREVNHRVKNNLASIISMLNMRRDHAETQGQAEFQSLILDLTACVRGMAAVHGMCSEKSWQPLNLSELCRRIIQGALHGLAPQKRISIGITPSELLVQPDQAHHLAFLLNELATNTRKHAASSRDEIRVEVGIGTDDDKVVLVYGDNGPGYPLERLDNTASGDSIGFELIKGIVQHNLGGIVRFANDNGAKAEITFKLNNGPLS